MKKEVNAKRDEQKQDVMRRGWKKKLVRKQNKKKFCFERDSFLKYGRVFLKEGFFQR